MIHLTWSILNGIILIYFLYIIIGYIVKGNKIFNPRFKTVSFFIMFIGVVQIISASNSDEKPNRVIINKDFTKADRSEIKNITLEDNLTLDINMLIKYSVNRNELIPIESNSFLTGLVSGYEWKIESFQASNYNSMEKGKYNVEGILKWKLFGITIYNELKVFKGTLE